MTCCDNNEEKLKLFLSQELDSWKHQALSEHLESCKVCQDKLSFVKGFQAKIQEAEAEACPTQVLERLTGSLEREKDKKVVSLDTARKSSGVSKNVWRFSLAAALFCVVGLGLVQSQYGSSAPEAVVSLVDHHDTCFHIKPSAGLDRKFKTWVDGFGKMPETPALSSELVAFDERECPAGEVRGGHLMYLKGDQQLSIYVLPAEPFIESYGGELQEHSHDGREIVLKRKGDWVYGVVARLPREEIHRLVDTDHMAILRQYLAQRNRLEEMPQTT